MTEPLLVARGARLSIDDVVAVPKLDLETTGNRLVIVGDASPLFAVLSGIPRGVTAAAAEALLNNEVVHVSGAARASGGVLRLLGHDVVTREHIAHVGAAPLDPPVPLEWTVEAYVLETARLGLAARAKRISSKEVSTRVADSMARTNIHAARRKPIKALHVAERRVLAITSALAGDPAVIVAEQPLAGLDGQAAEYVMGALTAAADDRALVTSVSRVVPGTAEGVLARSASDLAVFANAELSLFGAPTALLEGARLYRVTVRSNADALVSALRERGLSLEGGPTRFAIRLGEGQDVSTVLATASEVRSAVVEIVPLV